MSFSMTYPVSLPKGKWALYKSSYLYSTYLCSHLLYGICGTKGVKGSIERLVREELH